MKQKIPTILGILVLVIGVGAGVFLVREVQVFRLGAAPGTEPQDVRITNVTDTSFTASWKTDRATIGYLEWGQGQATDQIAREDDTNSKEVHSVNVTGVIPGQSYSFIINSNGTTFDNNGVSWRVITGPTLATSVNTQVLSGTIIDQSGSPVPNVLVFINAGALAPLSTVTTANGGWVIPLSKARTASLNANAQITDGDPLLSIFVQGGALGVATAQIYPKAAVATPTITLGQTYDFRSQSPETAGDIPTANVNLPETATESGSKFDLSGSTSGLTNETVTLESVDPGETITTTKPEFFGSGPPGEQIAITVESDPITDTATVNSSGNWNWSPPSNLEPGTHTITINWTDASGILRTLVRTFEVQAAGINPSFEATPSGTTASPSPSPTPTPSPKASASPSPSPTATASPTPRAGIPSNTSGTPVAGVSAPTIIGISAGVLLIIGSILLVF